MQASMNRCAQPNGWYGARPQLKRDLLARSAMRSSLFLVAFVLATSSAIAGAQDYSPRHGFWMGAGLSD